MEGNIHALFILSITLLTHTLSTECLCVTDGMKKRVCVLVMYILYFHIVCVNVCVCVHGSRGKCVRVVEDAKSSALMHFDLK